MGISFEPVTTADGRVRLAALADEITARVLAGTHRHSPD